MSLYISLTLIIILATVGLSILLQRFYFSITAGKTEHSNVLIIPIKGRREDAEILLRNSLALTELLGSKRFRPKVICLDCGADEETKQIINAFCRDYSSVTLCNEENVLKLFC